MAATLKAGESVRRVCESMSDEALVRFARICEAGEQYGDMAEAMAVRAERKPPLTEDERMLFQTSFKSVLRDKRDALLHVPAMEAADDDGKMFGMYKKYLQDQVVEKCQRVLGYVHKQLDKCGDDMGARLFLQKMCADYCRYQAEVEVSKGVSNGKHATAALEAYEQCFALAKTELGVLAPTFLGVALNYSVFYADVLSNLPKALELTNATMEEATTALEANGEEPSDIVTKILKLMRDNIAIWEA